MKKGKRIGRDHLPFTMMILPPTTHPTKPFDAFY